MPTSTPRAWSRARLAVALAFLTQGLVFISLTTRLPRLQDELDLSTVETSGLLLAVVLASGAGSVAAEPLAVRRGSRLALRAGLVGLAVGVVLIGTAPSVAVLAGALVVYGVAVGAVDAATNMQAVALEHRTGSTLLPSCHAAWTLGGVVGTLLTLATPDVGLAAGALVLMLLPLAASTAPYVGHDRAAVRSTATQAPSGVPWRRLSLVGLAIVLFYMVDTASTTWGSVYFDDVLDSPSRLVALATLPYLLASLLGRALGDGLTRRVGPVRLLRGGAVVAATGLLVITLAPTWPVGVVGFLVLGLGTAVIAPLSFSAAGAIARTGSTGDEAADRARVDSVIARFNQFNYVGALLGAVMTGIFGAGTLRLGFAVPALLVLGVVPLARVFDRTPAPA